MTERVVVTGAAGFVGAQLCRALLDRGWQVAGVDNFDPFYPRWLKERALGPLLARPAFSFVEADARDAAELGRLLDGAASAVHLAARAGVRDSWGRAAAYRDLNVGATGAVLEACARSGVRRVVYASSSSVYGRSRSPFRETGRLPQPASPYAASKRDGEALCRRFAQRQGMRIAVLRLFSVYGPGQRPDQALHRFARLAVEGRSLPLYGDGSSERDYTYVGDVARAMIAALQWSQGAEPVAECFNVGTGRATRLDRLVALLADSLGVSPGLEWQPPHPADAARTQADVTRARQVLGWAPQVTLEAGMAEFVHWHQAVYGYETLSAS